MKARIENLDDLYQVNRGTLPVEKVRALEVDDALIDTGATTLSLPQRLVNELGLRPFTTRAVCRVEVLAVPDDCPVLIGQIPLELLDFVVDPKGQRLIGNPAHGGQQMLELFSILPGSSED